MIYPLWFCDDLSECPDMNNGPTMNDIIVIMGRTWNHEIVPTPEVETQTDDLNVDLFLFEFTNRNFAISYRERIFMIHKSIITISYTKGWISLATGNTLKTELRRLCRRCPRRQRRRSRRQRPGAFSIFRADWRSACVLSYARACVCLSACVCHAHTKGDNIIIW